MPEVTRILCEIEAGNLQAAEQLLPLVYDELRKLAAAKIANEPPGQTLLPLLRQCGESWSIVLAARRHGSTAATCLGSQCWIRELPLQRPQRGDCRPRSLGRFRSVDGLAAELVTLHYFGGFPLDEAGELLGISRATAYRRWTYARSWLRADLKAAAGAAFPSLADTGSVPASAADP